jgi:hypothetical protein
MDIKSFALACMVVLMSGPGCHAMRMWGEVCHTWH